MKSIADDSLIIQTSSQWVPSTPHWFGEVALTAQHLRTQGILSAIGERVRFARRRFGHYDVIDFVAVLAGVCHQWRTDPGSLLPAPATFCPCLHGALWTGALALTLDPQPLSGESHPGICRSLAHAFSRGSARAPIEQRKADRRAD
jgi:hypothetical protein